MIRMIIFITFLLALAAGLASDLYVPSLPAIAKDFDISSRLSQLTLTIFLFAFAGGQFIYGPFSDKYGRKWLAIFALLIAFLGSFLCAHAINFTCLLSGRFLQGIGAAGCLSLARAIMRDVSQGSSMVRINSLISALSEAALALAPLAGGYLIYIGGWRANFYFLTYLYAIIICIIFLFFPETNKNKHNSPLNFKKTLEIFGVIIKDPSFLTYTLCAGLAYAALMCYFLFSPFLLQENLNLSPREYGQVSLWVSAALSFGAWINGSLVKKFDLDFCVHLGILLLLFSGALLICAHFFHYLSVITVVFPAIIASFGCAFLFSSCCAGALNEYSNIAGMASAIYSGLQMCFAFTFTFFASLFDPNLLSSFGICLALLGCMGILAVTLNRNVSRVSEKYLKEF
ncbi:MAG: multidrug effflux MFS transporter [Gammaproteobacteria bacterium]